MFGRISEIDANRPETFLGKCFITIDIDWAHDEIIKYSIELLETKGLPATWFVTHDTPLLKRIRSNPNFELGIHPNFNELLVGSQSKGTHFKEVIQNIQRIVPEAISVRSHSLVSSERILDEFVDRRLLKVSNIFVPMNNTGCPLYPFKLWGQIDMIPHGWQDNAMIRLNMLFQELDGWTDSSFLVVDVHPIHLFLNSECISRYEASRPHHGNPKRLIAFRNGAKGTYDAFNSLLNGILKKK
jgi:hypothetical protein